MQHVDPITLEFFRRRLACEYCGRALKHQSEPHHVFCRGRGFRLDLRENLIALGGPLDCGCHAAHHAGNSPTRRQCLEIIAKREARTCGLCGGTGTQRIAGGLSMDGIECAHCDHTGLVALDPQVLECYLSHLRHRAPDATLPTYDSYAAEIAALNGRTWKLEANP